MIPTINVTPHNPANIIKYNNVFEDTLSQLQNIRETVVQMKNSSIHQMRDGITNCGLTNVTILSSSLPDLSAATHNNKSTVYGFDEIGGCNHYNLWSPQKNYRHCFMNVDRRKSWTAIDDLNAVANSTNKSISLSSLDSEDQETIRVAEQRRRSARNSAGGISTHSLNEAELTRDFERITNKKSTTNELVNRIPLQKSISTSSIIVKDDLKAISRHLTDSEDENQSLLRAHTKIKVYDNVEKRRKRGSLFFRKKKDKTKVKSIGGSQMTACDLCGANINLVTLKEHQLDCKIRKKGIKTEGTYASQDFFDGNSDNIGNYNDDAPLIKCEFLNELPLEAHDLQADPVLGIELKEPDSWSPGVSKDILKTLKEQQIKRQEHIYEFIMTEKHHCQTLLVMQKVFVDSLERHFPNLNCSKMFPRLSELTDLHSNFLKQLRLKQREKPIVDSIADILLDFFSLDKAQHLRLAYGEFCANHRSALEQFKIYMTSRDSNFPQWYKHCLGNPLLKKKGIPECILFVTQRLTKYPLLIEPLLKSARDDKLEFDKLQHALSLVKELLVDVDACVAEKELQDRQIDIYQRIDNKSFAIYKNKPFRKTDMSVESRRCLKFEGIATLMQGRSKMQLVMVIVLTDCLCFLIENSAHNKYTFFTPEHKAGVVPLQKLLIREKAGTESRGIYIISSNPLYPEMYELKVQTPKDKNIWIQTIRQAVLDCPSTDIIDAGNLTAEEKLRIGVNKREIIEKMRQKDIEQALLLEEKLILQMNLMQKDIKPFSNAQQQQQHTNPLTSISAAQFLSTYGSYKDINVGIDCDTTELWKEVSATVQEISQLAASVYTASTGQQVSRSVSSVGEKHSGAYSSPILPKRAETFAGYDEKRNKNNYQSRSSGGAEDQDKVAALHIISPRLQELEEGKKVATMNKNPSRHQNESADANALTYSSTTINSNNKDNSHFALLQVNHNLHTLLCIMSQQMTTIQNLQLQLALYRDNPKTTYIHNDQLEELRNLQDKLQEEKTIWNRQKEQMQLELEEKKNALESMQERLKIEEEDIKQQREQLYRKMEFLSNQGLLLSPNTPLIVTGSMMQQQMSTPTNNKTNEYEKSDSSNMADISLAISPPLPTQSSSSNTALEKRKDRWRTASTMSKTPPVNLLSATNAPKVQLNVVKQKIPMKLSSLSSTSSTTLSNTNSGGVGINTSITNKVDKSASFNSPASISASVTQIFPLKLADKRPLAMSTQLMPQHLRTGSSPAIIQQPNSPVMTTTSHTSSIGRNDSVVTACTAITQRHSLGSNLNKNAHVNIPSGITMNAAIIGNEQNTLVNNYTSSPVNRSTSGGASGSLNEITTAASSSSSSSTILTPTTAATQNYNMKSEEEEIYF